MHLGQLRRWRPPVSPSPPVTTIVVPCFNERRRLNGEAFLTFSAAPRDVRFLFVNDGSDDGTLEVLQSLRASRPRSVAVLDLPQNVGKAEAVRQGMLRAMDRSDYAGFWDADLATPLEEIPRFVDVLNRLPEVRAVLGARIPLLGRNIQRRGSRKTLARAFSLAVRGLFGINVRDSQCGAKLFRVCDETRWAFARPFRSRWIFDVELLARLQRLSGTTLRRSVYEAPLDEWREVAGSKLKPRHMLRAIAELGAIRVGRAKDIAAVRRGEPAARMGTWFGWETTPGGSAMSKAA